jgi:hypothetical protein
MSKRCFCLTAALALLLSAPLLAQLPPSGGTVGVYFDEEGTVSSVSGLFSFPQLATLDAYVIAFWEATVGGASYSISGLPPSILVVTEEVPGGISIGSAFDGCGIEAGLTLPGFGFYGTPVVISHLQLLNNGLGSGMTLCVEAHCNYGEVVVSDNQANLFSASGLCGAVATESSSWGSVKNLYR